MQSFNETDQAVYDSIISISHYTEIKVEINGVSYGEDRIISLETHNPLFDSGVPMVGSTCSSEIDLQMIMPTETIPRMAEIKVYCRVVSNDDASVKSLWIQNGVFFIDTRSTTHNDDGLDVLTIHGYDAMLKAGRRYPSDKNVQYPQPDTYLMNRIAGVMGISVDERNYTIMNKSYQMNMPATYNMRTVLGYIAAMYAGNFVISDEGKLRLIQLTSIEAETSLLIDTTGDALVFGEDRIKV